jgi:hypothetical protein
VHHLTERKKTLPVTAKEFRKLALAFPRTEERSPMDHPDFRVCGKIFATLGYRGKAWAMLKLTPEQQEELAHDEPGMCAPVKGALGTPRRHQCPIEVRHQSHVTPRSRGRVAQQAPPGNSGSRFPRQL